MKKSLLILALLLPFAACKKSTPKPTASSIIATVNNTNVVFNTGISGQLKGISGRYLYSLQFIGSTSDNYQKISFAIFSKTPITKGTYSLNPSDTTLFPQINYIDEASSNSPIIYFGSGGNIIINSISNSNVQGTFSSYAMTQGGSGICDITNGKFNVAL